MLLPSDRLRGDGLIGRVPLTLRRRMHWGDSDTAQIAYTSRIVDWAVEACEYWWEQTLGLDWYQLNVGLGSSSPMVGLRFDFEAPVRVGDRIDLVVRLGKLGTASLTLDVEGRHLDGRPTFQAELTTCLIDRSAMKSKPFPDDWRRRPPDWPATRYERKAISAGRDCIYLRYRRRDGGRAP